MFSKVLIKLVDEAIVPAILLITVRIVSLVLLSQYLGVPFQTGPTGFVFSSSSEYTRINTYSLLYMVIALCLGLTHVVVKSTMFHSTHIRPPLAAKVYSLKLQHLIQDSFHLYSQGLIWLTYLYCLSLGIVFMNVLGYVYSWLVYTTLTLSALYTYIFILDAEKEILAAPEKKR